MAAFTLSQPNTFLARRPIRQQVHPISPFCFPHEKRGS
jgi:hypothetical protein